MRTSTDLDIRTILGCLDIRSRGDSNAHPAAVGLPSALHCLQRDGEWFAPSHIPKRFPPHLF